MSYEGRVQLWCQNGHYLEIGHTEETPEGCAYCRAPFVFWNDVNDTNCDSYGFIVPVEVVPAVLCTCQCGHRHESAPAVYEIPDDETPQTVKVHVSGEEYKHVPL